MLRRFGFRTVIVANGVATAVTFVLCALLGPHTPLVLVVCALFASGVCRSVSLSAYSTIGFADIGPDRTSGASALTGTVQQLATGLGIALAALALRAAEPLAPLLGLGGPAGSYQVALLLLALLPLAAVTEAIRLRRDAGAVVTEPPTLSRPMRADP
ncbi:hypothetical protein [Nonomuraea sp. NPDC049480]|uniref:hypothetical protein n=1 Tax=Nonomuraea sp. NPDC049480 TaxID=3364353 RepID=UPI00379E7E66